MARTNARTQRFIGMILDDIQTFLDDFSYHMEGREGRWTPPNAGEVWGVVSDDDLMNAHRILQNLIHREAERNKDRKIGYTRIENVEEAGPAPPEPVRCEECLFIRNDAKPRKPHGLTFCDECHHAQV